MEQIIKSDAEIHIPHNTIYPILKDEDLTSNQPKKSKRRKWIRYERKYSNSMFMHIDYKLLDYDQMIHLSIWDIWYCVEYVFLHRF